MHWNSLVTDKYNIVAIRTILENEAFTTTIQQKKAQRKESNRRKTVLKASIVPQITQLYFPLHKNIT